MSVGRTGDWERARRLLGGAPARLRAATETALRQEAQLLRREIVVGLTDQAPGGEPLAPLAPSTIAKRQLAGFRGTKALIERGDLRNAIVAIVEGGRAFVGVPRKARGSDGRVLADIAQVHEFGAPPRVIPITPAMRRFLFALFKQAGIEPSSGGGGGRGVVVVSTPARPFLRPAFRQFARGAQRRFLERVASLMGLK